MKKLSLLITVVFCISANAQITWTSGNNIATNTYSNMHPRMSLNGAGNPMVVWGRMSDQSVFFTRWNGAAFTTPIKLNPAWLTVATASWMGPDIASKGDTVYVVVKRTPETSDSNRIFIFASFNGGVSFNTPVELAFIADSISRFPTIEVDARGNPIVAFMKFNASFMDSRWVVMKSSDFGKTFSTDVKASGWGGSAEVCDCCPGTLICSGVTTTMLYRNNNLNIRDNWAGISTNSSVSFSSGFAVDNNNWKVMSCPSSGPDGVIIGDTLYSTFMSSSTGNYRTYFSKSALSKGSMNNIAPLTGTITGLSQQNYPRIATDGTAMAIVWKQTKSGQAQLPILFTDDISNGFTSTYDTVDLDNITNTDIAMSNGNIYVVWQDDGSGTVKYRTGTYTQASTSISETNFQNRFSIYPNPVNNQLSIQSKDNTNFSFSIFNMLGEKIYQSHSNIKHSLFNIHNFPQGIYFVQIQSGKNFIIKKIIKQ